MRRVPPPRRNGQNRRRGRRRSYASVGCRLAPPRRAVRWHFGGDRCGGGARSCVHVYFTWPWFTTRRTIRDMIRVVTTSSVRTSFRRCQTNQGKMKTHETRASEMLSGKTCPEKTGEIVPAGTSVEWIAQKFYEFVLSVRCARIPSGGGGRGFLDSTARIFFRNLIGGDMEKRDFFSPIFSSSVFRKYPRKPMSSDSLITDFFGITIIIIRRTFVGSVLRAFMTRSKL